MKIALVASAGGHLNELLKLERAWEGREVFFVTTVEIVARELEERYRARVYVVGESNHQHPWQVLKAFARCARIVIGEKPDVVMSTGAAHGCLMCALGKAFGARVVWVDSIANVERPSLSGRMVRHFADLFLVQWPELVSRYRGAEYHGNLL
jgi:UDP-N-acetylglucosamine:LPS N-acetylglucosamine transferase